jgi:hypothetical protein
MAQLVALAIAVAHVKVLQVALVADRDEVLVAAVTVAHLLDAPLLVVVGVLAAAHVAEVEAAVVEAVAKCRPLTCLATST